jgi:N6-adenosine-specific RNA methylase IME4
VLAGGAAMTRYRTIVADPPWPYDTSTSGHFAIPKPIDEIHTRRVDQMGYSTLSVSDLAALAVRDLAEPNAHLYLWTTNAFMVEAHEITRAWGFKPKTILTWGKVHQAEPDRPSMKTGYWFRSATEHIVFAVRGSLRLNGTFPTLYLWPRIGKHSVKPEAFYDLVEQASPGPYLELFSRDHHRLLWDVWGSESANTATLGGV